MQNIEIYSKGYCPYCKAAKRLLKQKGLRYKEYEVDKNLKQLQTMLQRSKRRTVPQIFFDGQHIGGFDDLQAYFKQIEQLA